MSEDSPEDYEEVTLDKFDNTYSLSDQAVSAIMMALQKGIVEREDMTETIKDFILVETPQGLRVHNTPTFELDKEEFDTEVEEESDSSEQFVTEEDL